jgi:protein-disulfide isomerase
LRVAVRHLPLADVHVLGLPAAEALEAAGAQGMFFELLDRLVSAPVDNEEELLTIAAGCVADPGRLREEVQAGRYRDTIVRHINEATASGAHVVPELYIDGEHYGGELKTDALARALAAKGAVSPDD